jgi:predicted transposase/invertase (TIGR01784 family)
MHCAMKTPKNIHDAFFRDAMSRREVAADYLRQYLPEDVTRHLCLDTLTISKDSFVSEDQARHYSDLLYEIKLNGGGDGLVYFLFEHKSFHDRFTALQILRYMVEIWELRRKQRKNSAPLPLIVPVVVYHGRSRREALRIRDLVTVPDDRCTVFVPDFEISFQDFSPEAETEIKGTIELRLLCSCLRAKNDPTSVLRVMEIFRLLHRLGDDACALQWVATIYRYLAGTMDIEAEVVHDIAQQTLSTNKRDTIMTLAERLHQQGLQEGRLEGKQNILQRLLAKRFGNSILGIGLQERLRSATPEELDTWTERILDASTIDDIFADKTTD